MTTACPPRHGDEAELYAQLATRLTKIVARQVRTSSANIEDACSFAWLQMLRYQPARETVLAWLIRVGTREAIRLDRQPDAARWPQILPATRAEGWTSTDRSRPISRCSPRATR